jgi:protein-S-isoprenylcysteine O-methyltransferase Ste14
MPPTFNPLPSLVAPAAFIATGTLRVQASRDPLNLALAAHALVVGVALLVRKPAKQDVPLVEQAAAWGFALLPMFFVKVNEAAPAWTQVLAVVGVLFTIWAILSLWRSFAIAPADRGLVTGGPYRLMRHPMYAGQMLSLLAILLGGASLLSWLVVLVSFAGTVWRILREERMIEGYPDYAAAVRWRLIPGVF